MKHLSFSVLKKPLAQSPLKAKPLRNPGQSLDEEIQRVAGEEILVWGGTSLMLLVIALMEWWRWLRELPPSPVAFSVVAAIFAGFGVWKIKKARKRLRALKLGRDGEKAVGQFLDVLREDGYRVFHDVVGEGINIDHVAIGKAGIFSIETKTFSKPSGNNARVDFDGSRILVAGRSLDRDPVVQAKAQASWLKDILKESTGRLFHVKPVILFPGWYVESSGKSDVWVLNPKALPAFLNKEPITLSDEDKKMAAYHLSRYLRTTPSTA